MKKRYLVAQLAAFGLLGVTASAQVPPGMTMIPMEPPTELANAIPLYKGVAPAPRTTSKKKSGPKSGTTMSRVMSLARHSHRFCLPRVKQPAPL